MASVDDIRVNVAWRDHPKRKKLQRRLGAEGVIALLDLWLWIGANKPDGNLAGVSEEDIEIAANWMGTAGAFVAALVDLRLLDHVDDTLRPHDWAEHQRWACNASRRSEAARSAADSRWAKRLGSSPDAPRIETDAGRMRLASACGPDAPRIENACGPDAPRIENACGPDAPRINPQCPSPYPYPYPEDLSLARVGVPGGSAPVSTPSAPQWAAPALGDVWLEVCRREPGDRHLLSELADRIAIDAAALSPPRLPRAYALALVRAFREFREWCSSANWIQPPASVAGFRRNYERAAEWVEGKRPQPKELLTRKGNQHQPPTREPTDEVPSVEETRQRMARQDALRRRISDVAAKKGPPT